MKPHPRWQLAEAALAALAIGGPALGGLWLRARVGPVRTRFLEALPIPTRRLPPEVSDDALFGGVDVAASLGTGTVVRTQGMLTRPGLLVLPMAERTRPGLAARLATALDGPVGLSVLALDEGGPEEALPEVLAERLALHLDLDGLSITDAPAFDLERIAAACEIDAELPEGAVEAMATTAVALGVASLRAPILALQVARALAAWNGRGVVVDEDLAMATGLVLAPRATQMPAPAEEEEIDDRPPEAEPDQQDSDENDANGAIPQELLLEAARAVVPSDLLDRLAARRAVRAAQAGAGAGDRRRGNRRGRPLPSQPGAPSGEARIDLIATLRAAAPWQRLRQSLSPGRPGLRVLRGDMRLRQFEERSDRAVIFVVDASGSAAMARLAEAKGAVELLLAQAYARRDHVALISFRGTDAELLLPPTRSLVQTKRRLAALPGGGGTPLAAGLRDALSLGLTLRGRGMTPAIALMTDGRANVTLAGTGGRAQASEEALGFARQIRARSLPSLVIDTGLRPTRGLDGLATEMGAGYVPLPRAQAHGLSQAVADVIGA